MSIIPILFIPFLVIGFTFLLLKTTITWKEFLLQIGIASVVIIIGWFIARHQSMSSVEHWHGVITGKPHGTQKCCHCHDVCVSHDKDGNCTSSIEVCAHSHDYWWSIATSVGKISVESCSGSNDPPAIWTNAQLGEPATVNYSYQNYLLADPDSLIVHDLHNKYLAQIPNYPKIYNLYKLNSVISDGPAIPTGWQEFFRKANSELGARKQVDMTVLLTKAQDPVYAQAVEAKWLYGPKNSLTVVIGVNEDKAAWARVVTISKVEALKIEVREAIQGKSLEGLEIPTIITDAVETKFKRTPMETYEYLAKSAEPKGWWLFGLYILAFLVSIGLAIWAHKADIFGDERRRRFRNWS